MFPESERKFAAPSVARKFLSSGVAVMASTACTHPIDVVKLRQQMDNVGVKTPAANMWITVTKIAKSEGHSSLYKGITPALARAMTYGSLRLGLYEPCRDFISSSSEQSQPILLKIAAGIMAGSAATFCTNPMELVKVKMQSSASQAPVSSLLTLQSIVSKEGFFGLWRGVGPAMARASALTAAQCATYDESKQFLIRKFGLSESLQLHLSASMLTGVVATLASSPFDTVKTRMMMSAELSAKNSSRYRNAFHCFLKVLETEGLKGLYKGWGAMYARLGPQTAITFVVYEKMRQFMGLSGL